MSIQAIVPQMVFFGFAAVLVFSAFMVILSHNSIRSALFLVLAFFATAGIWLLLEAEFLGLVLILVYVGAVMTLFLFVVMTLNLGREKTREGFVRYLPYGFAIVTLLVALTIYAVGPKHFSSGQLRPIEHAANYSNVEALGNVLYTDYAYSFELAGIILLVAIVAAITLSLRGRPGGEKIPSKLPPLFRREDRVRIVKMPTEKP